MFTFTLILTFIVCPIVVVTMCATYDDEFGEHMVATDIFEGIKKIFKK